VTDYVYNSGSLLCHEIRSSSDLSALHPQKICDGPVIGALKFRGKKAGRQFVVLPVIMQAFAALVFSGTGLIRTRAAVAVLFHDAFHVYLLSA